MKVRAGLLRCVVAGALAGCGGGGGPTGPSGAPVISIVNGATLPSAPLGATVVIQGSNFGASQAAGSGVVVFTNGSAGPDTAVIASPGDWSNTLIVTTVPSGAVSGNLVVKTSGGTSTPITFTVVAKVAFSPSTVSWTSTTGLPVGLSGHVVAAAALPGVTPTSVVYVVGGADSTNVPRDTVIYSIVTNTGTLGAWTNTTELPVKRAFAAAAVATPTNSPVTGASYLYVI